MKNKTLGDVGERAAIRMLAAQLKSRADVAVGIGDDCAVLRPGSSARTDWLLTSDPIIEGVHFLPDAVPDRIGHKAIGRVLSDIAAMGGEADWALIDVVAPRGMPLDRLRRIYSGMSRLARRHGMAVVGGDLSSGPTLELHAFGVGHVARGRAVLRSGARADDALFVTGRLGAGMAGRHLSFEPRLREGQWLCQGRWATAMLDLSDGLGTDLRRLLDSSGVGAEVDAAALPLAPQARRYTDGRSPFAHAVEDGEDFELLFTVRGARAARLLTEWSRALRTPCTRIGRILPRAAGVMLVAPDGRRLPFASQGYEHFAHGWTAARARRAGVGT